MNKYVQGLIESAASGDGKKMVAATQEYMQAAAFALSDIAEDYGGFALAQLIVVAELFAESLKSMADEPDLEAAEKLRERCTTVTIPTAFGRRDGR